MSGETGAVRPANVDAALERVSAAASDGGRSVTKAELSQIKDELYRDMTMGNQSLQRVRDFAAANPGTLTDRQLGELSRFVDDANRARQQTGASVGGLAGALGHRLNPASWLIHGHLPLTVPSQTYWGWLGRG